MKNYLNLILLSTAFGVAGASAEVDCEALSRSVTAKVSADKTLVLEVTSAEVAAAPGCACEIVKAVIKASKAEANAVAAIVEAAVSAAPEQMDLIVKCATAEAPDAVNEIQAVVSKLDPNAVGNPLNFPGKGPVGPGPGMDGGNSLFGSRSPSFPVLSVTPPITNPNPQQAN